MLETAHAEIAEQDVPDCEAVFRLLNCTKDGRASELSFELSSADKASNRPSLSVWAISRTPPEQAISFLDESVRHKYGLCAVINVGDIRSLRPTPDSPLMVPYLNVIWLPLMVKGTIHRDLREGADGHCGIIGLRREALDNNKAMYKSLRVKLSDLANESLRPIAT